ncbi:hypothetical protein D3C73_1328070 [compost metagenome]
MRLRSAGARLAHTPDSKVRRATATAALASASSVLATFARKRPSTGLKHSNVAPLAAAQYWPSMNARPSMERDWKRCSQSLRVFVMVVTRRRK